MSDKIGMVKFRVAKADFEQSIDWDELPLESQRRIAAYGALRLVNDRVGGEALTGEKLTAAIAAVMEKITSGDWGSRATGQGRLSEHGRAVRDVLEAALVATGSKRADAEKDARDPEAAFRLLAERKAKKTGRGDIDTIVDEISAAIHARAEQIVASAKEFVI